MAVVLSGASLALLTLPAGTASAAPPPANPSTVGAIYDNIPSPLPGNLASWAFEATSTSEWGSVVTTTAGPTTNALVTVVMSSWGCQTGHWTKDDCETTPGATFSEPITLNVYNPGPATDGSAPGSLIGSVTQTFQIPFRPSKDDVHCTGTQLGEWYDAASTTCFHGLATPIQFNLAGITLPTNAVISLAYNTSDYGAHPYGEHNPCNATEAGCGYDSLNVAVNGPPTVGTDPLPNSVYLNSSWSGAYCDASNPGVGHFVLDTGSSCWGDQQPAIEVQAPVATVLNAAPSIAQIIPGFSINLKLSAQLTTTTGVPLAFEHVTFTVGGGLVCVGITDATGTASCSIFAGVLQSVLDLGYQATFAGDGVLQPTSAHGPILVILGIPIL